MGKYKVTHCTYGLGLFIGDNRMHLAEREKKNATVKGSLFPLFHYSLAVGKKWKERREKKKKIRKFSLELVNFSKYLDHINPFSSSLFDKRFLKTPLSFASFFLLSANEEFICL